MKRLALILLFTTSAFARNITEKDLFRFVWVADPQLSPDGSQVAFVRVTVNEKKDRYETELWVMPATPGAAARRLTNGPADSSPRWSRDGKMLAFLRAPENGKAQIYLLRTDGGEPHALTSLTRAISSIAWAPTGNTIAFTASTKPEDLEKRTPPIHVKDVDWNGGFRLVSYKAGEAGKLAGYDMNYPVVLELKSPKGNSVKKNAVYTVTTRPELLVSRQEG